MVPPQVLETSPIVYPEDNGEPLATSVEHAEWIVLLSENLKAQFEDDPLVFVAADLLWYPTVEMPLLSMAPDVMVVFGVPKGHRQSYQQWHEEGIGPQVVFEIRSLSNTRAEMVTKRGFYEEHGVDEFYDYDTKANEFRMFLRRGERLDEVVSPAEWQSPRLGIRFQFVDDELQVLHPDGQLFCHLADERRLRIAESKRADREARQVKRALRQAAEADQRAEAETDRANEAAERADEETRRANALAAEKDVLLVKLRELGLNPDELAGGS